MTLRDVHLDDLPILFENQRDPEANRMAAFPARDWEAFLTHWTTRVLPDPTARKKTIVLADGRVAGNIGVWNQDGRRNVGYWLGREHWGQGLATAALAEMLTLEPVRPLHAIVAKHNVASRRVLEKCGFTIAGELGPNELGVEDWHMTLGG